MKMIRQTMTWPTWGSLALIMAACPIQAVSLGQLVPEIQEQFSNQELQKGPREIRLSNGFQAFTFLFQQTTWELKNPPQAASASSEQHTAAENLSIEERLEIMHRYQDHSRLWLIPLDQHPNAKGNLKRLLPTESKEHQYHREFAWLGHGHGYSWYGYMPLYLWIHLQKTMNLQEGDNPVAAAARGLAILDKGTMTANSADGILVQAGTRALPFLDNAMDTPQAGQAMRALGRIKDPEAGRMMVDYYHQGDPELARIARHYLIAYVRPEAEDLYFAWLDTDAGEQNVNTLLQTCASLNKPRTKPFLPRILASPRNRFELRYAFELSRDLSGPRIPDELLQSEQDIKTHGYRSGKNFNEAKVREAVDILVKARDVEAAAHIGVSLACATTKGNWKPANDAGIVILRNLPENQGILLAQTLSRSCEQKWVKERLAEVSR